MPVSTLFTRKRSACPSRLRLISLTACQIEGQTFERHREIDALQLDIVRHLQRAGREIENRLDARRNHEIDDALRRRSGYGDHGNRDRVVPRELLQLVDVVDRHAATRLLTDFGAQVVEEREDLEPFLPKPGVIRQREPEIAGADDRDAQFAIESENLSQMPLEVANVIADAADAELAEVREVLADLRRVQMELLGQRLRRDRAHAGSFELIEAAEIYREPVGGELGDLIELLFGFWSDRRFVR